MSNTKTIAALVLALVAALMLAGTALAGGQSDGKVRETPILRATCPVAFTARMDPLFRLEGEYSHLHRFIGNREVEVDSTGWSLRASGGTTCAISGAPFWTSSAWFPVLYDARGKLPIQNVAWYLRAQGDQTKIVTPPVGLQLLGNEQTAKVTWGCGGEPVERDNPPQCKPGVSIKQQVSFPNCWDGNGTAWAGGANVRYADYREGKTCPSSHPRHLPDESITISYKNRDGVQGTLKVSGADGERHPAITAAHGDIIHGYQDGFRDAIDRCLRKTPDNSVAPDGCVYKP